MRPGRGRIDIGSVPTIASISGVGGDLLAVVIGVLLFGLLLLLLEGVDRI